MNRLLTSFFLIPALFSLSGCSNGQTAGDIRVLPVADFQKKIEEADRKTVLDVRTPEEFDQGHLNGAINYNIYEKDFRDKITGLDKEKPVFVYCLAGGRSAEASKLLQESGFRHVYDLKGGMRAWQYAALPVRGGKTPGMAPDKFTREDFDKLLETHEKVLVEYYAPWCAPCKKMEPILEKLSKSYEGKVKIFRLNVEEAGALSRELNIDGIPVVAVYRDGNEVQRAEGFQTEENLVQLIRRLE